jgi:hypothetical protein
MQLLVLSYIFLQRHKPNNTKIINNMKAILNILFFLIFCFSSIYAQNQLQESCDCKKDFAFVTNYVENHYAGFSYNVTSENSKQYEKHKALISEKMQKETPNQVGCLLLLQEFLQFFRDNHLMIWTNGGETIDEKSAEAIKKFKSSAVFLNRERIVFDSAAIWNRLAQSEDAIEGIYENETYQVAVLRSPKTWRDYYGVITKSATNLWEKGQVKLEIKNIAPNSFQTALYLRNYSLDIRKSDSENPVFDIFSGLKKIYPNNNKAEKKVNFRAAPAGDWLQFKVLNDSTTYLHIKTFNGSLQSKFDSAYKKILPIIASKPNLLIDVRDNGGGSDNCWKKLAKYFYTKPFDYDTTDVFCTAEVIKRYEEYLARVQKDRKAYGWRKAAFLKKRIRAMKKAPAGTFISAVDASVPAIGKLFINMKTYKQSKVYKLPKKVIIMYNKNSASAAEGLIINGLQSSKVLTFGENSGGYIAFGNVMTVDTPSKFVLQTATQRTLQRFKYEKVGIAPQIRASNEQDWIEQTYRLWNLIK